MRNEEFDLLYNLAVRHFGDEIASFDVVRRVVNHNPASAYSIGRCCEDEDDFRPLGYVALLLLNRKGVRALEAGKLDAAEPDLSLLVLPGHEPAGIYVWGVVAVGKAAAGLISVMEVLKTEPYRRADVYARPASVSGLHLMQALHFERCFNGVDPGDKPLYRYKRVVNRKRRDDAGLDQRSVRGLGA